jgi:outer membrane biogenesis lipoprotein LolB
MENPMKLSKHIISMSAAVFVLASCASTEPQPTATTDVVADTHKTQHEHHHGIDGHATEHEHNHGDDGHKTEHEHHHGDDGHVSEHQHHHGIDGHANEHEHHHLNADVAALDGDHHHHSEMGE